MTFRPVTLAACVTLALWTSATVVAQAPQCPGEGDAEAARAASEQGWALLEAELEALSSGRRRRPDVGRVRTALEAFERQCAAGDDWALERIGASLMLLGRPVDALRAYDAFRAVHPLRSLEATRAERIRSNIERLERLVATVQLEGLPEDAELRVDGQTRPAHPMLRLEPGAHTVEVAGSAIDPQRFDLELTAGESTTEQVIVSAATADAAPPGEELTPAPPTEDEPSRPAARFGVPTYVGAGVPALVFLGLAIGLQVGADERARTYNELCVDPALEGCDAVLSEHQALLGSAIASYVVAGLAGSALLVFWIMDATGREAGSRAAFCVPTVGGISCAGRF